MKKKFMVIALLLTFILTGCSLLQKKVNISNSDKLKLSSKEVVENYFKYYNEKSKTGVLSTLTKWHNTPNMKFGFDSLKSINIIDITDDSTPKQKEAYMKYGRGSINGVKEENVKIYKVTYDLKLKNENHWAENSGKHTKWFTVIRTNKNSPWLIDDQGEG